MGHLYNIKGFYVDLALKMKGLYNSTIIRILLGDSSIAIRQEVPMLTQEHAVRLLKELPDDL